MTTVATRYNRRQVRRTRDAYTRNLRDWHYGLATSRKLRRSWARYLRAMQRA